MQTTVSRQVETTRDVATSVQSSKFNLSIMIAPSTEEMFLGVSSPMRLIYLVIVSSIHGRI